MLLRFALGQLLPKGRDCAIDESAGQQDADQQIRHVVLLAQHPVVERLRVDELDCSHLPFFRLRFIASAGWLRQQADECQEGKHQRDESSNEHRHRRSFRDGQIYETEHLPLTQKKRQEADDHHQHDPLEPVLANFLHLPTLGLYILCTIFRFCQLRI